MARAPVESDALVPEQQRRSVCGHAAAVHDLLVLVYEAEAIYLLVDQEVGVAHSRDADRPQHLKADDFDVLSLMATDWER